MANRSDNSQAPIDISEKKGYKVDIPLLFCAVLNKSYKLENGISLEQDCTQKPFIYSYSRDLLSAMELCDRVNEALVLYLSEKKRIQISKIWS